MLRLVKRTREVTDGASARTVWALSHPTDQERILRGVFSNNTPSDAVFLRALCWGVGPSVAALLPPTIVKCDKRLKIDFDEAVTKRGRGLLNHVLEWMLRTDQDTKSEDPKSKLTDVLVDVGLVNKGPQGFTTTGKGIQFCLATLSDQVSEIVASCVAVAQKEYPGYSDAIAGFALLLPQHDFGVMYNYPLVVHEASLLNKLSPFGVIYKAADPKDPKKAFYAVTPMIRDVAAARSAAVPSACAVIVETNFRVYGYCPNDVAGFYARILSQFLEVKSQISGRGGAGGCMLVCVLTHESATRAFRNGVTAAHITTFFEKHLRVQAQQVLPETVLEQLRLWEEETQRVTVYPTVVGVEVVVMEFDSLEEEQMVMGRMLAAGGCSILGHPASLKVIVSRVIKK